MGRSLETAVASVPMAIVLALGLLVLPAQGLPSAVAESPDCPDSPVTIRKLVDLEVPGNVCYGDRLLTFDAYVPRLEGLGGTSTYEMRPFWLTDLSGSWVALSTGPGAATVAAYVPPGLGRCFGPQGATCPFRWYRNGWARVSAHYDGPVARTCRYVSYVPDPTLTKQAAVRECRQKLIVLSVGPVVSAPATETAVVGQLDRGRPTNPLPWFAGFGVASLLLVMGGPARRPRDRTKMAGHGS